MAQSPQFIAIGRIAPEALPELQAVDPHAHTPASDGVSPVWRIRERALRLGVRIGITDHNRIAGAEDAFDRYGGEEWALPGIEVTLRERVHVLLHAQGIEDLSGLWDDHLHRLAGRTATTPLDLGFDELRGILLERPALLATAAHPFAVAMNGMMTARKRYGPLADRIRELDAIEVFNGQETPGANRRAQALVESLRAPHTAGSDGHHASEMGTVLTCFPRHDSFIDAVRSRRVLVCLYVRHPVIRLLGHSLKIPYHVRHYLAKLVRREG